MEKQYPLWLKGTAVMLGLFLLVLLLIHGKFVLKPLAFGIFFALLLDPLRERLERLNVGRMGAILLSMLGVFLVLAGIFFLLSMQFAQLAERLPEAGDKIQMIGADLIAFTEQTFGLSPERQVRFLEKGLQQLVDRSGQYLSTALGATTSVFTTLALFPLFLIFIMYYRETYRNFLHQVFQRRDQRSVDSVVSNIQEVAQRYILGMIAVVILLALLNWLGLWLVGLENALFFAVFAAILAVIPYIGIILGSLPAILWALLFTESLWNPVAVMGVFAAVQFLEGNLITPNIIGSQVSINPFMALLALIIGGQLWGISGMILSVPFLGILRCVFMEVESLRPYGYLLGSGQET